MSKADNKELEEDIKVLQKLAIEMDKIFYALNTNNVEERNAIRTVLKELKTLQEDYIAKDKIREILNRLKISDIEPWSTYKVKGEILFDIKELLEGK